MQPEASGNGRQESGKIMLGSIMKGLSQSATFRAYGDGFMMAGFHGDAQASQLEIPEISDELLFISRAELQKSEYSQRGRL